MLKQISLVHRKPGMTREEFNSYWKEIHAPVAARLIPGARSYVQNHLINIPGVEQEGDGIVELWFDDLAAQNNFVSWIQSDKGKELADDAANFLDLSKTIEWFVEEHVIL